MDLNLNLGSPDRTPPAPRVDFDFDGNYHAFSLPMSSHLDDILTRLPSIDDLQLPLEETVNYETEFDSFDLSSLNDIPQIPRASAVYNERLHRTGGLRLRRERIDPSQLLGIARSRTDQARQFESDNSVDSATDPERLMHNIRRSARLIAASKQKANDKAPLSEGSTDEKREKNDIATDFDCNICFDVAKEPVVTCCGHLFCWPCLFHWLHVHCSHGECPVCKGNVNESGIVPIYGRGSSEGNNKGKKDEEDEHESLNIPPRPQGKRLESFRQQLNGTIFRGHDILIRRITGGIRGVQQLLLDLPNELRNVQSVDRRVNNHSNNTNNNFRTTGRNNAAQGWTRAWNQSNVNENLRDQDNSQSQASTSSTMAMIQGELLTTSDTSLGNNNDGGSSMTHRRTVRFRGSNSMDASGSDGPQPRQRRRRN